MPLTQVLEEVAAVLGKVELPSESTLKKKRATVFNPPPPRAQSLKNVSPCFMVWADSRTDAPRMGNFVEINQTIELTFYGPDDGGLQYAREFFDATERAIRDQQRAGTRFNESVDLVGDPRTERPQEATIEWGGLGYPGFRMYLDLQWFEDVG